MRRLLFSVTALFLVGCGDEFVAPTDAGNEGAPPITGGGGDGGADVDSGGDAFVAPPARMFASLFNPSGPAALVAWDDPDAIKAPRTPDVTIPLSDAKGVVAATKKRVFVAGGTNLYIFDSPLMLTSTSTPKTIDKSAFLVAPVDTINVSTLMYEPTLDILVTADDSAGAIETFKSASTMTIGTTASAKFGTANEGLLHPLLTSTGILFGGASGAMASRTYYWEGAQNATGNIAAGPFLFGSGALEFGAPGLFVATADVGSGGAAVYLYQTPLVPQKVAAYELRSAFGQPNQSDLATAAVLSKNYLAVAVWLKNGSGSFLCILSSPTTLTASSACSNKITIDGGALVFRVMERKGSLFVGVASDTSSRLEIYRNPLSDAKPTVSLDVGTGKIVSGLSVAE